MVGRAHSYKRRERYSRNYRVDSNQILLDDKRQQVHIDRWLRTGGRGLLSAITSCCIHLCLVENEAARGDVQDTSEGRRLVQDEERRRVVHQGQRTHASRRKRHIQAITTAKRQ